MYSQPTIWDGDKKNSKEAPGKKKISSTKRTSKKPRANLS
jgi:hypothetical protein